jgi:hypothetical protein
MSTTDERSVPTSTTTVSLPEIRDGMIDANVALEALLPALTGRIEANRQRSERARHRHRSNRNGRADVEIKLTDHGLLLQCRTCARPVG